MRALKFVSVNHTAGDEMKQCVLCVWVLCWGRGILHQSLLPTPLTYTHTHTQSTQPLLCLCVCDDSYVSVRLCIENIKEKERLSVYLRERMSERVKNTFHGLEVV